MADSSPILISREAPRSRRLRRQSQQQSSCCCCGLVAASLLLVIIISQGHVREWLRERHAAKAPPAAPTAYFPLDVKTDGSTFLRYEIVPIVVHLTDNTGKAVQPAELPDVVVKRGDEVVNTVGGVEKLKLRWDAGENGYRCTWPAPWNAPCGVYTVEARLKVADPGSWPWETPAETKQREEHEKKSPRTKGPSKPPAPLVGDALCVARATFILTGRTPPLMPAGLGAATWENDYKPDRIPRPDGKTGDWRAMFDWCQFMGADTFWFRGAVTEVYTSPLTDEQPFNPYNIEAIPKLAAEAHKRGIRFGTWAAAYATYPRGSNRRKPDYKFAQNISLATGQTRDMDFISLLEEKRIKHLANFFAQIQVDPNVDYLGLDYMRSDKGGYEMVDKFAQEMPLDLPQGWDSWDQKRRWEYVAEKVEREWQKDPKFYERWNWFRAHQSATNLAKIIEQGKLTKPMWIFCLSWWHGVQHGQDPVMFTDAGVTMLSPMLYQIPNRLHFNQMVRDWNKYIAFGQANVVPGDQVDFIWHQKLTNPAAPEELYDRMVTAHRKYLQSGLTQGLFWHDISRAAIWGFKGPYPGTEWALAGGAAFTTCRQDWNCYPLKAELVAPKQAPLGGTADAQLVLTNTVDHEVKNIAITLADTPKMSFPQKQVALPSLGPGQKISVPVQFKIAGADSARANRFMLCARVTWPDADYGKQANGAQLRRDLPRLIIVMKYVNGT